MIRVRLLAGRFARKTSGSAGFDLFAAASCVVPPRSSAVVPTGVRTEFDAGLVALIRDRSGLAGKGVTTRGGVIDHDYRGVWGVVLANETDAAFHVGVGDRIAQVVFLPLPSLDLEGDGWELGGDERTGGFGSTGSS